MQAFQAAWADACKVEASTMMVPSGYEFLVGPISFSGPYCHLKFGNCNGVLVYSLRVSSPGDSPNADGIHLQNSQNVLIHTTGLSCGK